MAVTSGIFPAFAGLNVGDCGLVHSEQSSDRNLPLPVLNQLANLQHVLLRKFAPCLAFASGWIQTALCCGILGIVFLRPKKQMTRVHTTFVVASMQDTDAIRYGTTREYPCHSMSRNCAPSEFAFPIPCICQSALPFPTSTRVASNIREKAFGWWGLIGPSDFSPEQSHGFVVSRHGPILKHP